MLVKVLDLYTVSVVNISNLVLSKITSPHFLSYSCAVIFGNFIKGIKSVWFWWQVHEIIQLAECNAEHCRGKGLSTDSYRPAKYAYKYASRLVDSPVI